MSHMLRVRSNMDMQLLHCLLGYNWNGQVWKLTVSLEVEYFYTYDPDIPYQDIYTQEKFWSSNKKCIYLNSSTDDRGENLETIQMFISERVN